MMYFWSASALRRNSHLRPVRIAGAAAAAQLGGLDLLDDHLRVGVDQHLIERLVAADGDVLLDIVGADQAAVAQHDLLLRLEEGNVVPGRDLRDIRAP